MTAAGAPEAVVREAARRGEPPPRSLVVTGRAAVLLDVLMGLSVLAGLSWAALMATEPRVSAGLAAAYGTLVLAMVASAVARRLRERHGHGPARRLVVLFAVLGLLGLFVSDGPGSWPLFVMALLSVVPAFSPRTGVALVAALLLAQVVAYAATGRSVDDTVRELVGSAYLFGFVLVLAWLLAEHVAQRERIVDLLEEVRRGRAAEVELMLSDERTRSARDLHDGLGHHLSVMSMSLQFAERMRERDPDRAWEQVTSARVQAGEALTTMRRWVRALSPVRTEGASMAQSLDAIAESFRGTGLSVTVTAPGSTVLPDRDATLFLHRFVQEGLTNTLRHADASTVEVECARVAGELVLCVRDDGSPAAAERPLPGYGFGLRSLAERAADLGGSVSTSWAAHGMELSARLPLSGERGPRTSASR